MWQKCPICNGTGKQENFDTTSNFSHCKTCSGKGIISELTGLPPDYSNISTVKDSGDFRDNVESQKDYYGR